MNSQALRAVLYLRVSTDEQTVDNQLPALEAYAKSRGYEIVEVYSENESAWHEGHQHELARLLGDIRGGKRHVDILLCWALDRLSREGATAILNLVAMLKAYHVRVISLQESWTEAPGELGEVLYAIAGWVARMESQRRSERTLAGLARARREGKPIGKRGRDLHPRKRTGYLLRYDQKGERRISSAGVSVK
jgi:DNA invertase Pin-like site-specific DNA recombinase